MRIIGRAWGFRKRYCQTAGTTTCKALTITCAADATASTTVATARAAGLTTQLSATAAPGVFAFTLATRPAATCPTRLSSAHLRSCCQIHVLTDGVLR